MIGGSSVDVEDTQVEEVRVKDAEARARRSRGILGSSVGDLVVVACLQVVDGEITVRLDGTVDPGVEVGIG